jgi:hypothetical protein
MTSVQKKTLSEIEPRLFVGTREDAAALGPIVPADWCCISVTEYRAKYGRAEELPNEPLGAIELPFMQTGKADAAVLDEIATTIERELSAGKNVLVHCVHAHERSPLAIMWYLAWREGLLLEIAHARVAAKHPSTENRLKWVQGLNPCRRMSPQSTVDHPKTGVQSETTAPEEAVMPPDS